MIKINPTPNIIINPDMPNLLFYEMQNINFDKYWNNMDRYSILFDQLGKAVEAIFGYDVYTYGGQTYYAPHATMISFPPSADPPNDPPTGKLVTAMASWGFEIDPNITDAQVEAVCQATIDAFELANPI